MFGDKMHKILVIVFFLFGFTLYGQNKQIWPEIIGLEEFTTFTLYSSEYYEFSSRNIDNRYYIDNNGKIIVKRRERENTEYLFEYDGGVFIGINHGEFGGNLVYRINNFEYEIIQDNIRYILIYRDEVYLLTGLSHGWSSRGNIVKLKKTNEIWEIDFIKALNSEPKCFTIYNDQIFIITTDGINIFDGNDINVLLIEAYWRYYSPDNIYINNEIIGIGLRGCIAIIDRRNNAIKYYK
jgi:hypothetical protein